MTQPRSPQPPAPYPEEVPRTPLRTRFDLDGGRALELGKFYQVGTGTVMGTEAPRVFYPGCCSCICTAAWLLQACSRSLRRSHFLVFFFWGGFESSRDCLRCIIPQAGTCVRSTRDKSVPKRQQELLLCR